MSPEFKAGIPPTGPGKTKIENETEAAKQKLAELGYTLERIEHIEDKDFQVYRKPITLNCPVLSTIGIENLETQRDFNSFIERFNNQIVMIDEFGSNHEKRRAFFIRALDSSDTNTKNKAHELKHASKLRWNFTNGIFTFLIYLMRNTTNKNIQSKLEEKIEELKKIQVPEKVPKTIVEMAPEMVLEKPPKRLSGDDYSEMALPDKIQYVDDVDKIFIEAINEILAESTEKA